MKGLRKLVSVAGVRGIVGPSGASSANAVITINEQGGGSVLGMKPMPPGMEKYAAAFEKKYPGSPPHGPGR